MIGSCACGNPLTSQVIKADAFNPIVASFGIPLPETQAVPSEQIVSSPESLRTNMNIPKVNEREKALENEYIRKRE